MNRSEQDKAKETIANFICALRDIDYGVALDIVDECQYRVNDYLDGDNTYDSIEAIVLDYLDLGESYIWPFITEYDGQIAMPEV